MINNVLVYIYKTGEIYYNVVAEDSTTEHYNEYTVPDSIIKYINSARHCKPILQSKTAIFSVYNYYQ